MENIRDFSACPSCGKSSALLNIFECACGKTYCDDCSGGGLIDLPRCPVSDYHENMKKVGIIGSSTGANVDQSDVGDNPSNDYVEKSGPPSWMIAIGMAIGIFVAAAVVVAVVLVAVR